MIPSLSRSARSSGQERGFAADRKSAMSLPLAYQRVRAVSKASASSARAACRSSTAMVMWSRSRAVSWSPAARP